MLKCWDSDPEDRPRFTKISSNMSKALEVMSGYLDVSLPTCTVQVQSKAIQNETSHSVSHHLCFMFSNCSV